MGPGPPLCCHLKVSLRDHCHLPVPEAPVKRKEECLLGVVLTERVGRVPGAPSVLDWGAPNSLWNPCLLLARSRRAGGQLLRWLNLQVLPPPRPWSNTPSEPATLHSLVSEGSPHPRFLPSSLLPPGQKSPMIQRREATGLLRASQRSGVLGAESPTCLQYGEPWAQLGAPHLTLWMGLGPPLHSQLKVSPRQCCHLPVPRAPAMRKEE